MYISLEEAKRQCNVELEYTGDDEFITDIILDVEAIAARSIRQESLSAVELPDGTLPRDIRRAMLLLIGTYYKSRENEILNSESAQLTHGYDNLIALCINYGG